MTNNPSTRIGLGSSFYALPKNDTGSIVDGEVWKTIQSGKSSYHNIVSNPNNFYHGVLAFNFNTFNGMIVNYHTQLSTNPPQNRYDLYTVMLKEVMHLLGITSLMNADGNSIFGNDYKYYSRYDLNLKTLNSVSLIKNSGQITLENYSFNNDLSLNILRPSCTLPNFTNMNTADNTSCNNGLYYESGLKMGVYTPTCFEIGNSLSCFEDQIYPTCTSNFGNNKYFVNSNRPNLQITKRYLKPEERMVLNDIGYKVKDRYGSSTTLDGFFRYREVLKTKNQIVGINDGFNENMSFTFYGNINENISILGSQILGNDINTNTFEGLKNHTDPNSLNITNGNSNSTIVINSSILGVHLLSYIPKDIYGNTGNITYIFFSLSNFNNCGSPISCNFVVNGSFEENTSIPNNISQINKACNWEYFNFNSVDYYHRNCINFSTSIPSNNHGVQETINSLTNHAYAGFYYANNTIPNEIFRTELHTPLVANTNYKLSFLVSKADVNNYLSSKIEAFITSNNFAPAMVSTMSDYISNGIYLVNPTISNNTNNWETITFEFIAAGDEKYLYLGGITKNHLVYTNTNNETGSTAYYYIDNVILTQENEFIATDDIINLSFAATTQTSTVNVLNNDLQNGIALPPPYEGFDVLEVTGVQPIPAVGSITINSNGLVVAAPYTSVGTYTITYQYISACGVSNEATVTVNIIPDGAVFQQHPKFQYLYYPCYTPDDYETRNVYNLGDWEINSADYNGGVLLNGQPVNATNTTVSIAPGLSFTEGCSISPNGIFTAPDGFYGDAYFSIVFCSTQNPSICSEPIVVFFSVTDHFFTEWDVLFYNQDGVPINSPYNNTPNPTNILTNDLIEFCWWDYPNSGIPATTTNSTIEIVSDNSNGLISIDTTNGNISLSGPPNPEYEYNVVYKLCSSNNTNHCSIHNGVVKIIFINQ